MDDIYMVPLGYMNYLSIEQYNTLVCLSVCWSVLHGPIAYSLLGGGVPILEQRLCGTLDSIPLRFKSHYVCTHLISPPDGV